MSVFSKIFNWGSSPFGLKWRFGISLANSTERTDGIEHASSAIYTCCKVLSDNVSRMPLQVMVVDKAGRKVMRNHKLYNILRHTPNGYQNPQAFWSTVEFHRNYYGNGFVKIHRNQASGYVRSLELIHPSRIEDCKMVNNSLYYYVREVDREGNIGKTTKPVLSDDMLHFKALAEDGYFGMSPVYAARNKMDIQDQAEETIRHFYENRATSTLALQSELGDARNYKVLKEAQNDFQAQHGGAQNAGKVITLPPNTKLVSMATNYADAQLIETMKFTKDEIAGCFNIPMYMLGATKGENAEQNSLTFRNYTIAPIARMYRAELEFKLLTPQEKNKRISIEFDLDVLVEMDYKAKVSAVKEQVVNGLMTPNEGALKLGNSKIEGTWGDLHFVQAQYIPLEQYEKYNPLLKDDPNLKTKDKS
jgi:HK97 family phage portal protein